MANHMILFRAVEKDGIFDFWILRIKNKKLREKDWLIFKSEKQFIPNLFKFYIKKQHLFGGFWKIIKSLIKLLL